MRNIFKIRDGLAEVTRSLLLNAGQPLAPFIMCHDVLGTPTLIFPYPTRFDKQTRSNLRSFTFIRGPAFPSHHELGVSIIGIRNSRFSLSSNGLNSNLFLRQAVNFNNF